MDEESKPVRWAAIGSIQTRRDRYVPGSDSELIAERAIDLLLGENRAVADSESAARDAWRNASFSMYRSRKREQAATARYSAITFTVVETEDGIDATTRVSAEDTYLAEDSELCAYALQRAALVGDFGPALVARLIGGATITEAAAACGISRASAYRAVKRLRTLLADARPEAEAA
jgi:hypothetical protein